MESPMAATLPGSAAAEAVPTPGPATTVVTGRAAARSHLRMVHAPVLVFLAGRRSAGGGRTGPSAVKDRSGPPLPDTRERRRHDAGADGRGQTSAGRTGGAARDAGPGGPTCWSSPLVGAGVPARTASIWAQKAAPNSSAIALR